MYVNYSTDLRLEPRIHRAGPWSWPAWNQTLSCNTKTQISQMLFAQFECVSLSFDSSGSWRKLDLSTELYPNQKEISLTGSATLRNGIGIIRIAFSYFFSQHDRKLLETEQDRPLTKNRTWISNNLIHLPQHNCIRIQKRTGYAPLVLWAYW